MSTTDVRVKGNDADEVTDSSNNDNNLLLDDSQSVNSASFPLERDLRQSKSAVEQSPEYKGAMKRLLERRKSTEGYIATYESVSSNEHIFGSTEKSRRLDSNKYVSESSMSDMS